MIELILTHISIWCPALVAVLSTVFLTVCGLYKFIKVIKEFRNSDDIKALTDELRVLRAENKELNEKYNLMLDEITKIHNYYNEKKKRG